MRCAIVLLGCDKMRVDCEVMAAKLSEAGHEIVAREEEAEAIIVSTCAFIRPAVEESSEAIERALKFKREGRAKYVIVVGCLPQRFREGAKEVFPEVDAWLGVADLFEVDKVLRRLERGKGKIFRISPPELAPAGGGPRLLSTPPWTAYLKIGEGCEQECSFCVIPQLRGRYRSRPLEEVVAEARWLAGRGVKEVVLVSQDSMQYGLDLYGRRALADLVRALDEVEGIRWIRLLYLSPIPYLLEVAKAVAESEKALPYFDVPVQHASASVLKAMRRRGSAEEFRQLFEELREAVPEACLRTSVIVGFPGEGEEEFEELLRFVEEVKFDRLGAFVFSPEPEAEASKLEPKVPEEVARERYERLMEAQRRISRGLNRRFVGRRMEVLLEKPLGEGWFEGRSYRDAPEVDASVRVYAPNASPGEFVNVLVTEAEDYDLVGRLPL